jgi:transposase-like protein
VLLTYGNYSPEICKDIIEWMEEGLSIKEVAANMGISRRTLYHWIDPESNTYKPELHETIEFGKELSEAWWLKQGRENLNNKNFHAVLYMMNMSNRFDWTRKDKIETNSNTSHTEKKVVEVNITGEYAENIVKILRDSGVNMQRYIESNSPEGTIQ